MPKLELTREDFRLLHQKIIAKANPEIGVKLTQLKGEKLLPDEVKRSPFYGTKTKQDLETSINFKIKHDASVLQVMQDLGEVNENNEWNKPPQFGSCLEDKRGDFEIRKTDIKFGKSFHFYAFYIYVNPSCHVPGNIEETLNKINKYQKGLREEVFDIISQEKEGVKNTVTNFYLGLYYSAKAYEIKKIGFSLQFEDDLNGVTKKILAKEWGFHKAWEEPTPEELLAMDSFEEEGQSITEVDLLKGLPKQNMVISEVGYKGEAEINQNCLYCDLISENAPRDHIYIICNVQAGNIKAQKVIRGIIQSKSAHDGIVSAEIVLILVQQKTDVFPLDLNLDASKIEGIGTKVRYAELYLMNQRRLMRVSSKPISDLEDLKPKGIKSFDYINLLPGVYRVWNIGLLGIIQSRIHIGHDFRAYLIPYFKDGEARETKLRVQWCWMNINTYYEKIVSLTSYYRMSVMNHAIIDFKNPLVKKRNGKVIYAGIYSSVGHSEIRELWNIGGLGSYMLIQKENVRFNVRKFNLYEKVVINEETNEFELRISEPGMTEFKKYIIKHKLEDFYFNFEKLMSLKYYRPIRERLKHTLEMITT